jgi:phospholipase/carboxylesterase
MELLHRVTLPGSPEHVIVLFHGTGGGATSLLELGRDLDPDATLIGLEGSVLEHGARRFFARVSEGVFDYDSLHTEGVRVTDTLTDIRQHFPSAKLTLLGYSNGANMIAYQLISAADCCDQAVLLRPMGLGITPTITHTHPPKTWLARGNQDPLVSTTAYELLLTELVNTGITPTEHITATGHGLLHEEIIALRTWLGRA